MAGNNRQLFQSLAMVSSMGISVVLAIAIGVWFGLTLDRLLGTKPWFFYIFLFIGIAAGFKNVYVIAGREIRKSDDNDQRGYLFAVIIKGSLGLLAFLALAG